MMSYGTGYPFGHLGSVSPLKFLCTPPAYSLAGQCEKQRRLWHPASTP